MRLLLVALASAAILLPALAFYSQVFGLSDGVASVAAMITSFLVVPIVALTLWKDKPGFDVIPIDQKDPLMFDQRERARAELHRLLEALDEGQLEAFVKFPMAIQGNTEHVWGIAHSHKDNSVIVSLASTPVGDVDQGILNRMTIPFDNIEDWMLRDCNGKFQGGYTMLAHAQIYARDYGKVPKKYRRQLDDFVDFKFSDRS